MRAEVGRTIPGVELFFGESVIQYLADLADEAYAAEADANGYLLGKELADAGGEYVVISGASQNPSVSGKAIGWFRISEDGLTVSQNDISQIQKLLGYRRAYSMVFDSAQGAMATFVVENGVARKVKSAMIENY